MQSRSGVAGLALVVTLCAGNLAGAATFGTITPNFINGTGTSRAGFTIVTVGNLELGLRAHLRYDSTGHPQNIFNYNPSTQAYEFDPAHSFAPVNKSIFNFDFSIDTNADGNSSNRISSYSYALGFDTNPGLGVSFGVFDPIVWLPDNTFGTNSTLPGGGTVGGNAALFSVAQNSQNMGFGYLTPPQTPGLYNFYLTAFDAPNHAVATTAIKVWVGAGTAPVPLPAGLPLLGGAFAGLALLGKRRKTAA